MAIDKPVLDHLALIDEHETPVKTVAYFDMDRTLLLGYSAVSLVLEGVRKRHPGMRRVARQVIANIDNRGGGDQYVSVYHRVLHAFAGLEEDALIDLGQTAFDRHLAASIYREARQIVRHHQALGHKVVIVSAATRYQVQPVAEALGVDDFCCTELCVADGVLTGDVKGELCYGEGKVTAARKMAMRYRARLDYSWFYSDSKDDLPLLQRVGHPVTVNPSSPLADYAVEVDWPVLRFSSRGKPNIESMLRTVLMVNSILTSATAGAASWVLSGSPAKAQNTMVEWLADSGAALAGLDFKIKGLDNLESVRPAVFVFNHQSLLDSIVLAYLLRHDFVALCKHEIEKTLLLGAFLKANGTIFIDRVANDQSHSMRRAQQALSSGQSLVIAPEGTRSSTGELLPFKPGAFVLAKKMRVPLIPIVLHNVDDALPKGKLLLRPSTIKVTIMSPLMPEQLLSTRIAARQLRERYQSALAEPWESNTELMHW